MLTALFLVFLKIGAFAFGGGYAVLPLIRSFVVEEMGWLTTRELTDLISLSQMTPGPIAINSATFIGTKVAGLPGAITATLANVLPQFVLMMTLGYFLFGGRKLHFLDKILAALKPAIVGLIAIAALSMTEESLFLPGHAWSASHLRFLGLIGFLIGFYLYRIRKWSLIRMIGVAAAFGLVLHAAFPTLL